MAGASWRRCREVSWGAGHEGRGKGASEGQEPEKIPVFMVTEKEEEKVV